MQTRCHNVRPTFSGRTVLLPPFYSARRRPRVQPTRVSPWARLCHSAHRQTRLGAFARRLSFGASRWLYTRTDIRRMWHASRPGSALKHRATFVDQQIYGVLHVCALEQEQLARHLQFVGLSAKVNRAAEAGTPFSAPSVGPDADVRSVADVWGAIDQG
jgi:hypothetical protein